MWEILRIGLTSLVSWSRPAPTVGLSDISSRSEVYLKLRCPISTFLTRLAQISSVFHDLKYNILLSRLSRSVGAAPAPRKSIFVAICEPAQPPKNNPEEYATAISAKIKAKLELRHANYRLNLKRYPWA